MKVRNVTKFCSEPSCNKKLIFLLNPGTAKFVPVEYDLLTTDEVQLIESRDPRKVNFGADVVLCFNNQHHTSHFKTCTKPDLFSS
jgi:hypothetical protein